MRAWRSFGLCSVITLAGAAAANGPPHSACRRALEALDARERALSPSATAVERDAWRQAQRSAALHCLGRDDAPPRRHPGEGPVRVAPVIVPEAPRPRIEFPPPAPPAVPAPPTITSCDPAGCWASDGTRWQRNGPDLVGPRGLCSAVGGVLRCP